MVMGGFKPIRLEDYIELHLQANPGTPRNELVEQLENAIAVYRSGTHANAVHPSGLSDRLNRGPRALHALLEKRHPRQ